MTYPKLPMYRMVVPTPARLSDLAEVCEQLTAYGAVVAVETDGIVWEVEAADLWEVCAVAEKVRTEIAWVYGEYPVISRPEWIGREEPRLTVRPEPDTPHPAEAAY